MDNGMMDAMPDSEAGTGAAEPAEVMIARLERELADEHNTRLRMQADFENFRKRMRAERDQEFGRGSDRVLGELLGVLDDFDRALQASDDKHGVSALRKGVELIHRQLAGLLERYGIAPMSVEGKPFDPKYHDAVARVATASAPEHSVVGEIQRGYLKNGEVFRPAKVAVAVSPDEPNAACP